MSVVTFRGHLPVILSAKSKGSEDMKQILIVEDDSFLNKMLDYNLTADGYGVTSALNARTARSSASLYPLPSFLLMRAALSQPGALRLYDFPRRDTSQPIPSSSCGSSSSSRCALRIKKNG